MTNSIPRSLAILLVLSVLEAILLIHDFIAPLPAIVRPALPPVNPTLITSPPTPIPAQYPQIYTSISSRPIFSPTRRPPPVSTSPAAQPARPPQIDFTLIGVVNAPGKRFGLVTVAGNTSAVLVYPGSKIEGWTVVKINASSITIRSDNTYDVLNFMP